MVTIPTSLEPCARRLWALLKLLQPRVHVFALNRTVYPALSGLQRLKIAKPLDLLQNIERVKLAGNGQVLRVVGRNLEEQSFIRPSFAELAG